MPDLKKNVANIADNQDFKKAEMISEDYEGNMFADGNNRAETDAHVKKAPDYDLAVHTVDSTSDPVNPTVTMQNPIKNLESGNIGTNEGFARGAKDADRTRPVDIDPQEANTVHAQKHSSQA